MEFALFYGLSVLWSASTLAGAILIVVLIIGSLSALWIALDGSEGDWTAFLKAASVAKCPLIGLTLLTVLTPSKSDLYFIAGGGLTLMAAQNEEVQKLPENAVKAVNSFLERVAEVEK